MDRDKPRNRRQINHPISEVTMFHNRLFNVFGIAIALVLMVMTVLTVQAGLATKAVADRSYDQVEQQRGVRAAADRSYDLLEAVRADRSAPAAKADDSYDKIDSLRAHRTWESAAASYDPRRENDAFARWLILAQNSGQLSASFNPQRANDAYAARWQRLAQMYGQH